jgi:hypothetical protein
MSYHAILLNAVSVCGALGRERQTLGIIKSHYNATSSFARQVCYGIAILCLAILSVGASMHGLSLPSFGILLDNISVTEPFLPGLVHPINE